MILRLTLALLMTATPLMAQEPVNLDPGSPPVPGAVALYLSAHGLYGLGQAAKDPMMVLAAARMMRGLAVTAMIRSPEPVPKVVPELGVLEAGAMLDTARKLDVAEDLSDLIYAARSEIPPQTKALRATASVLEAGAAEVWTLAFFGGTYAEVAIVGRGDGNLDLSVSDDKGGQVCVDRGSSDAAICGFAPGENGDFTVTVTNSGATADVYTLLTN
jgi:hypothetical protein